MQFELWTRFALPFVRLDSLGIQRIRQKLPANRNPFTFYKRVIISIDTLKSDRYLAHLQKQRWDAVVILEGDVGDRVAVADDEVAVFKVPLHDPEGGVPEPPLRLERRAALLGHREVVGDPVPRRGDVGLVGVLLEEHP